MNFTEIIGRMRDVWCSGDDVGVRIGTRLRAR